jgi:hypothetical protein
MHPEVSHGTKRKVEEIKHVGVPSECYMRKTLPQGDAKETEMNAACERLSRHEVEEFHQQTDIQYSAYLSSTASIRYWGTKRNRT